MTHAYRQNASWFQMDPSSTTVPSTYIFLSLT
jgi:hypothetical protein